MGGEKRCGGDRFSHRGLYGEVETGFTATWYHRVVACVKALSDSLRANLGQSVKNRSLRTKLRIFIHAKYFAETAIREPLA